MVAKYSSIGKIYTRFVLDQPKKYKNMYKKVGFFKTMTKYSSKGFEELSYVSYLFLSLV